VARARAEERCWRAACGAAADLEVNHWNAAAGVNKYEATKAATISRR
jgi:hypothetical protein